MVSNNFPSVGSCRNIWSSLHVFLTLGVSLRLKKLKLQHHIIIFAVRRITHILFPVWYLFALQLDDEPHIQTDVLLS